MWPIFQRLSGADWIPAIEARFSPQQPEIPHFVRAMLAAYGAD
jgi:hypothetical protein